MTRAQRFFMTILPKRWADDMRAESQAWQMRCSGCGATRSVWDAGGIRWKAAAARKQARSTARSATAPGGDRTSVYRRRGHRPERLTILLDTFDLAHRETVVKRCVCYRWPIEVANGLR